MSGSFFKILQNIQYLQDVKFGILDEDLFAAIHVGEGFDIPLSIKNQSSQQRTVFLTVTLSSVYYTGVYRKKLKKEAFEVVVGPRSGK